MAKKIILQFQKFFSDRSVILLILFLLMSSVLVLRLFDLQIVKGRKYAENFTVRITKTRTLKSTRGNIYDVNGKLLAYNKLSNAVTIEDNETYSSNREKNLSLNGEIHRLTHIILENGDVLTRNFHIIVNEAGEYSFDTEEETTINRFRADVFGYRTVDELKEKERTATADDIIKTLSAEDRFGLVNEEAPYRAEELQKHGLPESLTPQEALNIITVRYQLGLISYQRYMSVTVAADVSDQTVASVKENSDLLPGVNVSEDYIRVYNNAEAMAPIIGYTGRPSGDELAELEKQNDRYSSNSIIGKAGMEQYMETTLQGTDGSEEVTVDNLGRVLQENESSRIDPIQGNDVYLSIDSDLQTACYHILEQRIAGVLLSNLSNEKTVDIEAVEDNDSMPIPIYDVYNAMIENHVLNTGHFSADNASETEKALQTALDQKRLAVEDWLSSELNSGSARIYNDLDESEKDYVNYIYYSFLTQQEKVIDPGLVDTTDPTYQKFAVDGTISLRDYLLYAANQNWIDLTKLAEQSDFITADEVYQGVIQYVRDHLLEDEVFDALLYKYMLLEDDIQPVQIIQACYDQNIFHTDDGLYDSFRSGDTAASDLILAKISNLELTPAQLALDPCSGSIVLTDPSSGQVRACVTYPGYDNNRLANTMDTDYYYKLNIDKSSPFYNKATQQLTAPGSTFKLVMAAAGITERVVDSSSFINCTGIFGQGLVEGGDQVACWYHAGHGLLDLAGAIQNSCNVYFCTIGYNLGVSQSGVYDQSAALTQIQHYCEEFGLDQGSGLEISESLPHVTDNLPIPSSIGQGTHQYTTSQLARYAAVLQNKGTVYDLSLLDKVTDPDGKTLETFQPEIIHKSSFSEEVWNNIQSGMSRVIDVEPSLNDLAIDLYGKTGTAQESKVRPDHALMVGYAHKEGSDYPDIAFAVRIAYGYSSKNAVLLVRDTMQYYYAMKSETETITNKADTSGMSNVMIRD